MNHLRKRKNLTKIFLNKKITTTINCINYWSFQRQCTHRQYSEISALTSRRKAAASDVVSAAVSRKVSLYRRHEKYCPACALALCECGSEFIVTWFVSMTCSRHHRVGQREFPMLYTCKMRVCIMRITIIYLFFKVERINNKCLKIHWWSKKSIERENNEKSYA